MAYNNSFQRQQHQRLFNLLKKQQDDHVKLIVGENRTEFDIHRVLLASISPVFEAMLYGQMQEAKQNAVIEITDMDAVAFQSILNHAHCTDPLLTFHNIIAVRQIADKYQISLLSQLCDQLFPSLLNHSNICSLLSDAVALQLESYLIQCKQTLSKLGSKAVTILQSSAFLSMNIEAMQIFLQSDSLNAKEEDIWDGVVKWANYQMDFDGHLPATQKRKLNDNNANKGSDDRKNLLKQLCPFIRFGLMDATYFIKKVKSQNCLTSDEIAEVLCYIQCNDETCNTFSIKPRSMGTKWSISPPKAKVLKYTLKMQSKYDGLNNSWTCLQNHDLKDGVGTSKTVSHPWISASFECNKKVTKIMIGAADKKMSGNWGPEFLTKSQIQWKNVSGKWETCVANVDANAGVIHCYQVNLITESIRIIRGFKGRSNKKFLGIGCFQIYGWSV
eukprot:27960_1